MAEKTASLTVLGGPFAGTRCALPESGTVTVGSAEGSTLRLDLPTVSPYHARIEVQTGRVTVHDTGADRALHVNDNPLEPGGTVLRNGDILWLGAPGEDDVVMIQCVLPRRPVEAPAPAPPPPAVPSPPPAPPGPATPTPEIETQALWSTAGTPEAPSWETGAEPVPEPPKVAPEAAPDTAAEAAPEGAPPKAPEEERVFAEPSLVGASDKEVADAVKEGEEVVFTEEPETVVGATEVAASAAPTVLMASPEEIGEPQAVSIDFGEGVAVQPEPVFAPPPVVEAEPAFAPEPAAPPQPLPPAAPAAPKPPPLPPARGTSHQTAAKPLGSVPPLPASRPAAPPRPATPSPAPRPARPAPHAPTARREARPPGPHAAPHAAPHAPAHAAPRATPAAAHAAPRPAPHVAPAHPAPAAAGDEPQGVEVAPSAAESRKTMLLALAGAGGVLVLAGVVWVAWRSLAGGPSTPRPRPTPIVRATPPPALPAATPAPAPVEPTPEPVAPTPIGTPTPAAARPTPTPAPTPTPRPTPTPASARPTPTPAAAGPSTEALMAQQKALEAQSLLAQAETALRARQYDAAVTHLDGVLRLDPASARATTLRADAVRRRDLARRRFAAGTTVVQGQKSQAGGLAGFDTGDADLRKAPDFLGRVDFEMTPPSGIEAGDAWTLRVYVVNEGKKAIRVNGLVLGTTVNGTGSGGPLSPRVREIAPQQRSLVAETAGTWAEGTTSWTAEVTVTGGKGESLRNTIAWR